VQTLNLPNIGEIDALVRLVEDPDPDIFSLVREALVGMGTDIVHQLETRNEFLADHHYRRMRKIIDDIQFNEIKTGALFRSFSNNSYNKRLTTKSVREIITSMFNTSLRSRILF